MPISSRFTRLHAQQPPMQEKCFLAGGISPRRPRTAPPVAFGVDPIGVDVFGRDFVLAEDPGELPIGDRLALVKGRPRSLLILPQLRNEGLSPSLFPI